MSSKCVFSSGWLAIAYLKLGRADDAAEGGRLITRALEGFDSIGASGWAQEAAAALAQTGSPALPQRRP